MQNIDYTAMYADNADFKRYVDRYCTKHRVSVAEALQHYLVHPVFATVFVYCANGA